MSTWLSNRVSAAGLTLIEGSPFEGALLRLQCTNGSAQITVTGSEVGSGASLTRTLSLGPWVADLDLNGLTSCRVTVDDVSSGATVGGIWTFPGQDKGRLLPRLEAATAGTPITAPIGAEQLLLTLADVNVAITHPLPVIALAGVSLPGLTLLPVVGRTYTFSVSQVITWYCRTL